MSLATSGGLGGMGGAGGAGGLVMAHPANAMARPANAPPGGTSIPMGGMAPPSSAAAALGADLVDKQQEISLKTVKELSHMPLVAIDMFATNPHVASFPPKSTDPAADLSASLVGKMKNKIHLMSTETAHKTFRKWLSKSKGYEDLQNDVFAKSDDKSAVIIESPQKWLGLRRLDDAPEFLRKQVNQDDSNTPAIAEESSQILGVTMTNSTLDGSVPQNDDFDRVVCKIRLHTSKKALTVLPEEATQLVLNQAQHHVAKSMKLDDASEDIVDYPCCIAVPAPYCTDSSIEALLDATGGTGVMLQRSTCALAGALLRTSAEEKPNSLLVHINKVLETLHKDFQKEQVKNPDARFVEDQLILLTGLTSDTVECTAIQISAPQNSPNSCLFGNFKVLCNVSYRHESPETIINKCISELFDALDAAAPEVDAPIAMVSYGSSEEQKIINSKWEKVKKGLEDWEEVPHFYTKPDCVALGTSVLGAVTHGRLSTVVQVPGKKAKSQLAIRVQNVAPVAVGVMMNYHGGAKNKWMPVKTIFDFDRRVPAGPYQIDLNAAECVVHQSGVTDLSDEDLLKAIKDNESSKYIPKREAAALNLRVQIVQKSTRDGEWKKVGDDMSPLVMVDKDDEKTACERVVLQLSLGVTGLITHELVGERESVVQAVKTARNSALRYYLGIFAAIAFFGGFLIKSYWEERVFERDTRRLLAYYKNVIPGSMSDGDLHNARYLVWKYRSKKDKLWRNLEKKYGEPVLHEWEWPEPEEDQQPEEEEAPQDLDEEIIEETEEESKEQDL